jgi:hypothetical protein
MVLTRIFTSKQEVRRRRRRMKKFTTCAFSVNVFRLSKSRKMGRNMWNYVGNEKYLKCLADNPENTLES